jgi:hypothetical protein
MSLRSTESHMYVLCGHPCPWAGGGGRTVCCPTRPASEVEARRGAVVIGGDARLPRISCISLSDYWLFAERRDDVIGAAGGLVDI